MDTLTELILIIVGFFVEEVIEQYSDRINQSKITISFGVIVVCSVCIFLSLFFDNNHLAKSIFLFALGIAVKLILARVIEQSGDSLIVLFAKLLIFIFIILFVLFFCLLIVESLLERKLDPVVSANTLEPTQTNLPNIDLPTPTSITEPVLLIRGDVPVVFIPGKVTHLGISEESLEQICKDYYCADIITNFSSYREVIIDDFYIDVFEVSETLYRSHNFLLGDLPKTNVTWNDAQEFCNNRKGRLPLEAEWEYAARVLEGKVTLIDDIVDITDGRNVVNDSRADVAWSNVYFLQGNVREWVMGDEASTSSNELRVVRGGPTASAPFFLWLLNRDFVLFDTQSSIIGFRCVYETSIQGSN